MTLFDIAGLGLVYLHPDNIERIESLNRLCLITLKTPINPKNYIERTRLYVTQSREEVLGMIAEYRFKHDLEDILNA